MLGALFPGRRGSAAPSLPPLQAFCFVLLGCAHSQVWEGFLDRGPRSSC